MTIKTLDDVSWELVGDKHDFHVRLEHSHYVVDLFLKNVDDADEAHIDSEGFESLDEAIAYCLEMN